MVAIIARLTCIAGLASFGLAPWIARAAPDADTLIARLARPPESRIEFAEIRFSPLLRAPIVVTGELAYGGPGSFDRRVVTPYSETVTVRGERVRVERPGESSRTFALRRAPELQGLLAGFVALFAGDASIVRANFAIEVGGDAEFWSLSLVPLDRALAERLQQLRVSGIGDEPRCVATFNAANGASVMVLGDSASSNVTANMTLDAALLHCRIE